MPNISWVKDKKPDREFFHRICIGDDNENNLKVSMTVQQFYCQSNSRWG
jgi:hypothetical protein